MTIDMWNDFKAGGHIMLSYTFARSLNIKTAVVLSEIVAEFNKAYNNDLNSFDEFLCSPTRMSNYLGFSIEEINIAFDELEEIGFISVYESYIEDTICIGVHQDEIINFKNKKEKENLYGNWDDGLVSSLNPVHKANYFSDSTNKIRDFIESHTKQPQNIPIISYSCLDSIIKDYETESKNNILSMADIKDYLYNMVSKEKFNKYDFDIFIRDVNNLISQKENYICDEIPMDD